LENRVEQIENSIRNGRKSRGIRLNSKRAWKSAKKIWMEHARYLGPMKRPNLWIIGVDEEEEIQTKGIDTCLIE
jgi:hypothetical protein